MYIPSDKIDLAIGLIKQNAQISTTSVLILVACDVDALCGARILTRVLQDENIRYTLRPVLDCEDLGANLTTLLTPDIQSVILLNCGGSQDISQIASPDLHSSMENVTFYILDSHLPHHPSNVENTTQVLLFDPRIAAELRKDEDPNLHFFGASVAQLCLDLALKLSIESTETVWLACVGLADMFLHDRLLHRSFYFRRAQELTSRLGRHINIFSDEMSSMTTDPNSMEIQNNNNNNGFSTEGAQTQNGPVAVVDEFKFELYRHSSLYDAMQYSKFTATGLQTWKETGKRKLSTILVKLGIPVLEASNFWSILDARHKRTVNDKMQDTIALYGLDQVRVPSFVKTFSLKMQISAIDMVHLLDAILEEPSSVFDDDDETRRSKTYENFWTAYEVLSPTSPSHGLIEAGLKKAVALQKTIYEVATSLFFKKQIISSGPFRYVFLPHTPEMRFFERPQTLTKLLSFIRAILEKHTRILIGHMMEGKRNNFGAAFSLAASKTNSRIKHHHFDASVVEVQNEDVPKFVEYLHTGLV